MGLAIFLVLLGVYHLNGDVLAGNDAKPNLYLVSSLLKEGNLSFGAYEMPFMFVWTVRTDKGDMRAYVNDWDDTFRGQYTYRFLRDNGMLDLLGDDYYIVRTDLKDPSSPYELFVNTFGIGAGLSSLPVLGLLHLITGDLASDPAALWYGGKFVAAAMVAGSALFIYLAALAFTTRRRAVLVAITYGLGTCVWSISSQALWQHGPNGFFLALGTFLLTRIERGWRYGAFCGLAYGAAVLCRPTSALVVIAVGGYLLITNRKALVAFILAGLPLAAAVGAYNTYYMGKPYEFGQGKAGHIVAKAKTGSEELWQTPLWKGAAGLMVSPSRGLLIYSPVMAFAFAGLVQVWRKKKYAVLRPLTLAMVGLLAIAFAWFDWWGGWCFGYRPIVDTMPFFALLLVPVIDWVVSRKWAVAVFALLLAWSVLVQVLGAFSYNVLAWNSQRVFTRITLPSGETVLAETFTEGIELKRQPGAKVVETLDRDIDKPEFRHRLWSISDSQLIYYLRNFANARRDKKLFLKQWLDNPSH